MILIYSGLPASGKTTKSRALCQEMTGMLRINYDETRQLLFGSKGPTYFNRKQSEVRESEKKVKEISLIQARTWLEQNPYEHHVVIDNTNLTEGARAHWVALGKSLGIEVVHEEMTTSVAECVERDRQRTGDDRVGQAVIDRMALFTGWIDWAEYDDLGRPDGKDFVVVDIDGTLSDPSHRLHWVKKPTPKVEPGDKDYEIKTDWKPRWDKFHAEVDKDGPKTAVVDLVKLLGLHYHVIIVSGRSPEHGCGIKTEDWLIKHLGPYGYRHLFMRAAGDYRPDYEHKQQILDLLPKDRIAFVLDDRDQVVNMWRKNGLTCLQVAPGAF